MTSSSTLSSPSESRTATIPPVNPSQLYRAFLAKDPAVRQFYGVQDFSVARDYPTQRRAAIAKILAEQNQRWGASAQTIANVDRFAAGAAAIVTGQQVGLFGGQLMSLLKALTAIKLAAEQTAHGVDTVPIFWLATEDHDLDEVRSATVIDREHRLQTLTLAAKNEGLRVGDVVLGEEINALTKELRAMLGDAEVVSPVERCYAPGTTLADGFAELYAAIFGHYGLILIDNRDAHLHVLATPIFSAAAEKAPQLNEHLQKRSADLERAGFHAQVHVDRESTMLFHLQNGKRVAIKLDGPKLKAGKQTWTAAELRRDVEAAPQDFSANALLRPVVQDFLLPTATYVGGPAEIAYFAQSEVAYRELLGRATPIVPRASATLVEPGVARLLEKFGIAPQEAFKPAEQLALEVAARQLPADVSTALARSRQAVEGQLEALEDKLSALDPSLADAARNAGRKMRYQLQRLGERASRAELRRKADLDRQVRRLSASLYPRDTLQEREIAAVSFLAAHGLTLLETLYRALDPPSADHRFIWL